MWVNNPTEQGSRPGKIISQSGPYSYIVNVDGINRRKHADPLRPRIHDDTHADLIQSKSINVHDEFSVGKFQELIVNEDVNSSTSHRGSNSPQDLNVFFPFGHDTDVPSTSVHQTLTSTDELPTPSVPECNYENIVNNGTHSNQQSPKTPRRQSPKGMVSPRRNPTRKREPPARYKDFC